VRTTIDKAGRLVIPKALRDQIGLRPGPVEVEVDGSSLRVAPIAGEDLEDTDGLLVIPASGEPLTPAEVQDLRGADQR
jgi:AbrB family looped-hinge helix DNA binding protein